MTPRQRLLTVMDGGIPDRVPISTYEMIGYDSLGWYNRQPSYARLMDRIRRDTDCIALWGPRSSSFLASGYDLPRDVHRERDGNRTRHIIILHTPAGDLRQVREIADDVHTNWHIEHPCKSIEDVEKALSVPYEPVEYDFSDLPRIRAEVAARGIIMSDLADPALVAADLMSFQDFALWAFEHPDHFGRTVQIVAERMRENRRRYFAHGHVMDLYRVYGPEYFTAPYQPPEHFRRFVLPHIIEIVRDVHAAGGRVRIHCHGRIAGVLDMILESGADGTDPCEPPPDGDITLAELKRRTAGRRFTLFGNIELKLLENGAAEDVRTAVRAAMDEGKPGGHFVLMPSASPINIPLSPRTEQNYYTYIDAALEYGSY